VSTDYEPYVADPTEPPPRRRLARLQPLIIAMALIILVVAAGSRYFIGRGEEDPALEVPAASES
jgi:hypothetical protein